MRGRLVTYLRLAFLLVLLATSTLTCPASAALLHPCLLDGRGSGSTDMQNCPTRVNTHGDSINAAAGFPGARHNAHGDAFTPIDPTAAPGHCRYVDNSSGNDYFIPFNSSSEWFSFLDNSPSSITLTHCAKPFTGELGTLKFGPTSVETSMGDTGDSATAPVTLPYWRTAQTWPPSDTDITGVSTHTFNHNCYQDHATPTCWNWVTKTCTGCSATDPVTGACTKSYDYDCSYCGDNGSVCTTQWTNWSETFNIRALALDSDVHSPSWQATSTRITGTTRPNASCCTRCTFNGHDCTCNTDLCEVAPPPPPPPPPPPTQPGPACGTANGVATATAPTSGLCGTGSPTAVVLGSGVWSWSCQGSDGSLVSCSAPTACVPWGW